VQNFDNPDSVKMILVEGKVSKDGSWKYDTLKAYLKDMPVN